MSSTSPNAGDSAGPPSVSPEAEGRQEEKTLEKALLGQLSLPSDNYKIKERTLVFRLSELAFGSLLAAYILGFISFAVTIIGLESSTGLQQTSLSASRTATATVPLSGLDAPYVVSYFTPTPHLWSVALQVAIYVIISGTYAYLTAAMYMRYHLGVLTMPGQVEWSRLDFTIAVGQAGLFGISMLVPVSFFLCVAVALWAAIWRQYSEFDSLAVAFKQEIVNYIEDEIQHEPRNNATQERQQRTPITASTKREEEKKRERGKRKTENELLKEIKGMILAPKFEDTGLKYWRPVIRWQTVVLTILSIPLLFQPVLPPLGNILPFLNFPGFLPLLYCVASAMLFIVVWWNGHKVLSEGARFINKPEGPIDLNKPYQALVAELSGLEAKYKEELQKWVP